MIESEKYYLSYRNCLDKLSNIGVPVQRINSLRILPALKMCKGRCADFSFPIECCVSPAHVQRKKGRYLFKVNLTIIGKSS